MVRVLGQDWPGISASCAEAKPGTKAASDATKIIRIARKFIAASLAGRSE
jgi:hypothetical protein